MKKILICISILVLLTGCSLLNTQPMQKLVIEETENNFILEDVDTSNF